MARKHHQEQTDAIRKLIIDAALQICLDDGYREVTVRRIGDKIGYSTGVIYYHFKDKQDILNCLDKRLDEETYKNVGALISSERSLRENLETLYKYTCDLAYTNPEAYKRIFTSSRIENNVYTRNLWIHIATDCLQAAADRNEISKDDIELKAKCLLSFILGYNFLFFELDPKLDREVSEREAQKSIDLLLSGILNA